MIEAAKEKGVEADTFYALELLNATGVVITITIITTRGIQLNIFYFSAWSQEVVSVKKKVHGI